MGRRIPEAHRLGQVVQVQLKPEIAERVRAEAAVDDRGVSQVIRSIVYQHYRALNSQTS